MRVRAHLLGINGCVAIAVAVALTAPPAPARAADEGGVARMQACTPTTGDFVSLGVAPEVSGTVPVGAGMHRLWDLGVTWKDINPAPGTFNWGPLDAQVAKVEAAGARPLLVLGMTPAWAAANPSAGDPRWGLGTASPPRDINDWRAYVSAVVERYGSRIAAYEVWNEANLGTFWSGTPEQMADLTAAAFGIIKARQPQATVVLPSVTLRLRPSMRRFMVPFLAALGARDYPFDAFAIHSYPSGNLGPQDRVNDIVYWQSTVVDQLGASSPILDRRIFDTEVNFGLAGPGATPGRSYNDEEGAALIQQTYLDSRKLGIDAVFWYLYTAAPYSLLGVQLWSGSPAALAAWQATRRVFATGTPCVPADAPNPFDVDRQLAAKALAPIPQPGTITVVDDNQPLGLAPPAITGNTLRATAAGWSLTAQGPTVRSSGAFGSPPSGTFTIQGNGYAPGSAVYAWLMPAAVLLASVRTDASGAFSTTVTIPDGTAAGDLALQVNGLLPTGPMRSASIGARVLTTTASPVRTAVTFAAGKRALDQAGRSAVRALVTSVPSGITPATSITAHAAVGKQKKQARALARARAKKVAQRLRKAGLTGTIRIVVKPASTRQQATQADIEITWS